MTVAEPEMPASEHRLVALARWDALIFLYYGIVWVGIAASLAMVIAPHALGEVAVEGSGVLGLPPLPHLRYFVQPCCLDSHRRDWSALRVQHQEEPPKTLRQVVQMMLKDPVIVGALVVLVFPHAHTS
ncbi:hypothetical protein ZWY2020_009755 [Hordeum vulgare]|nr:hypothetical protein ZWY2020_009755 [Hordeum vulgare]